MTELDAAIARRAAEPFAVGAREYVAHVIATHARQPALLRVLYAQAPRLSGVRDLYAEAERRIVSYLEVRAQEVRPRDRKTAALLLVAAVEGIAQRVTNAGQVDVQAVTDETTTLVVNYLSPGGAA